jgi:hypothetical protein
LINKMKCYKKRKVIDCFLLPKMCVKDCNGNPFLFV